MMLVSRAATPIAGNRPGSAQCKTRRHRWLHGTLPQACAAALTLAAAGMATPPRLAHGAPDTPWLATLYAGIGTDGGIEDLPLFNYSLEDSYFAALGLGRVFAHTGTWMSWEAEGQVVQHFGQQDHLEFNALLVLRWLPFPWDGTIDTSFAIGDGLSYATEIPEIEAERNEETAHLLNYLMLELDFALPRHPQWSFVARAHHRSGIHGLFDGVSGGSNFWAAGIRYRF